MHTRLTQLLGIEHPLVLPGMSWIATPDLVAAVSNAGGLGILALGPLSPAQTRASIEQVRALTDHPFGVNAALLMPGAADNVRIALELEVPVINFSLGKGDWLVEGARRYGGKVIATVTTLAHAQAAVQQGVDALMATGHEAAAHGGAATSLSLIPALRDAVDLPIIGAGGFADGRGLMAALALGADGIAMGSRFATCQESPLHAATKQAVVTRSVHDTVYSPHFDGLPARYMLTPTATRLTQRPMSLPMAGIQATRAALQLGIPLWQVAAGALTRPRDIRMLACFGAATPRLKAASEQGDLDYGMQFIGQSQGLIHDVPSVAELVKRLMAQADHIGQQWGQPPAPPA